MQKLREQAELYQALIRLQSDLGQIMILSEDQRPIYIGEALSEATGYSMKELWKLRSFYALVPIGEPRLIPHDHGRAVKHFETVIARKDGTLVDLEVSEMPFQVGTRKLVFTLARDITERNKARQALEHQALHDALTGLPNRVLLRDRLEQAIRGAQRAHTSVSLLILDLDHFKEVNDAFGHRAGDSLLKLVGLRLMDTIRETDTVARLGGDEYAVLLASADPSAATHVAAKLLAALETPFEVRGRALDIGASIGIASYPEHAENAEAVIRRADIAMYVAKRSRRAYALYSAAEEHSGTNRLALMAELRQGIAGGELRLHYQPIVSIPSRGVNRMEALVRWQHPSRGLVPPDEFISLAEQTGLIQPLTYWVLKRALRDCGGWHAGGHDLAVAVNISMRNLLDPEFPLAVGQLIEECRAEPSWLRLEITESVIMADPGRTSKTLDGLRGLGISLSIDDFGSGYSSLAYLHRIPVDELKIDKSFVSPMRTDNDSRAIVRAAIELAHNLRLQSVAEGIEDQETWDLLAGFGCDAGQGFYIARPLDPDHLVRWLTHAKALS